VVEARGMLLEGRQKRQGETWSSKPPQRALQAQQQAQQQRVTWALQPAQQAQQAQWERTGKT
jgi:hypothetical protein